jgi:uncharacterized protein VirK/YbjX
MWLVRRFAAFRVILFPLKLAQLRSLQFMKPFFRDQAEPDHFFFLTHTHYLSKYLSLSQRVDCAVSHYSHEQRNFGPAYHRSVYRSLEGLTLWHRLLDGTHYRVMLRATEDYRYEGDLSVLCFVNETRVCRISFSYVNGHLFGLHAERAMFVTRNQTDRNPCLQKFRDTFRQNSPQYFCLAAVCGIAMANGMRALYLIDDDAQIAFSETYSVGFKNSYSGFWKAFGAQKIDDRHAYTMSIPLELTPLVTVKHRNRALGRRRNWLEVALSARLAMLEDRTSRCPPPIEDETSAFLPSLHTDGVHGEGEGSSGVSPAKPAAAVEEEVDDTDAPGVEFGPRHRCAEAHRTALRQRHDHKNELSG